MQINLAGPFFDSNGYGEFCRSMIVGLHMAETDLFLQPITLEQNHADQGEIGQLCSKLMKNKNQQPTINIVNMIPRFFSGYKKTGVFNVGITMFEGSYLPADWVSQCNEMNLLIVPSKWNKTIFEESGVYKPIEVWFPGLAERPPDFSKSDKYRFYSIFEWTERKNPVGLLKAYWSTFVGRKDVVLTIKTSSKQHNQAERAGILAEIENVKKSINLLNFAEIVVITEKYSSEQMYQLHENNDCMVLPTRAEGLGIPLMEAMAAGNPVMATKYSGQLEFMNENNSYLLNCQMIPISNMGYLSGFYSGDMWWADADLHQLSNLMKSVVANRVSADIVGQRGRQSIIDNFSIKKRGQELVDILAKYKGE